jgi:poly(hydroxyalkanoate) depolymerase family esterase
MRRSPELRAALELTRAGKLDAAMETIQRALANPRGEASRSAISPKVLDLASEEWTATDAAASPDPTALHCNRDDQSTRNRRPLRDVVDALKRLKPGSLFPLSKSAGKPRPLNIPAGAHFETRSVSLGHSSRNYKVYVPAQALAEPRSLLIMLHGCTQNPDDFAAGTRMNQLAEEHGFIVAYPAQPKSANPSSCWNWFNPRDQMRGTGEPAIIAALTANLIAEHDIDRRRVFAAGLSAGGGMAAILGATYPDLYCAIGVHSGLPYRAASDLVSALTVMRGQEMPGVSRTNGGHEASYGGLVPTIVFHGAVDKIVHPSNGAKIINLDRGDWESYQVSAGAGRGYKRMITRGTSERIIAEHWLIEGGGHAWFGGSVDGSYTDPLGPDASREMVRFFFGASPPREKEPERLGFCEESGGYGSK